MSATGYEWLNRVSRYVVVIPKRSMIFLRVQKCGQTSIAREMLEHSPVEVLTPMSDAHKFEVELFGPRNPEGYYTTYAVVRNPWDRVVSAYRHFLEAGAYVGNLRGFLEGKAWLKMGYDKQAHMLPCSWWTHHDGKQMADVVLRFEDFEESARAIAKAAGIVVDEVPHRNATVRRDYHEYYDEWSRNEVGRLYAEDVENFGYEYRL